MTQKTYMAHKGTDPATDMQPFCAFMDAANLLKTTHPEGSLLDSFVEPFRAPRAAGCVQGILTVLPDHIAFGPWNRSSQEIL